jgi:UDP-N-acetylmuramate--alanine ligase
VSTGRPYTPPPGSVPTLPVPDAGTWRRVHVVGIGGAGMSSLARMLLARGFEVTGSDLKEIPALGPIRQAGATVFAGHRPRQVDGADAIVVSTAVPAENVEVREAEGRGIPVFSRAQVLAALMRGRRAVAVAGTHGKTTTTSMISVILSKAGRNPSYVIGGDLNESGSGAEHGDGDVFVVEADESDGTFLLLPRDVAVITNVEEDHLNFYSGQQEIEAAYAAFADPAGVVVACSDDPGARAALDLLDADPARRIVRYGFDPDAQVVIRDAEVKPDGSTARIDVDGHTVDISISVRGRHNVVNAAAALAVAWVLEVPLAQAAEALRSFSGVHRRFEIRGTGRGAVFVDDYAHHPTEVAITLQVARMEEPKRLLAVLQPHRYTRTRLMWRQYAQSVTEADAVVVTDVFGAAEQPIPGVTGKLVVDALVETAPGKRVVYLPRRSDVAPFLAREARQGDLIITLGCGDIGMVIDEALDRIGQLEGTST